MTLHKVKREIALVLEEKLLTQRNILDMQGLNPELLATHGKALVAKRDKWVKPSRRGEIHPINHARMHRRAPRKGVPQ